MYEDLGPPSIPDLRARARKPEPMAPDLRVLEVLARHGVPFVVIGGHAVNFHGSLREIEAEYIGNEIDPTTGIERTHPVTAVWETGVELDGIRFASLEWLRRMKRAAGRPKDLLDLENLPDVASS